MSESRGGNKNYSSGNGQTKEKSIRRDGKEWGIMAGMLILNNEKKLVIDGDVPKEFLVPDELRIRMFLNSLDENDHCAWAHFEEGDKEDGK